MADQLLSKDFFYLNASYYNDTDIDQPATIHVEDSSDILTRSDGWMVHVTRFSVDSMKSLVFVEKDESASWEIQIVSNVGQPTDTFKFTLDRDYATPQDLIDEMNLPGRFRQLTPNDRGWEGDYFEMYRFELDPAGRIRLRSQPGTRALRPDWFITYQGTPTMNKLLGFDSVSPYLRWSPNASHRFCRAVDLLYSKMPLVATPQNIFDGDYWEAINTLLRSLLNGVRIYYKQQGVDAEAIEPTMVAGHPYGTNLISAFPRWYGSTPSRLMHEGEGHFPVHNIPVITEWLDVPHAVHNVVDHGPKCSITQMHWETSYQADEVGVVSHGELRFIDIHLGIGQLGGIEPGRWPAYKLGPHKEWTGDRYMYPWQSIPGYWWSGTEARGVAQIPPAGCVSIEATDPDDLSIITLANPLPAKVQVGHDMWLADPDNEGIHSTHAIETISADRRTIELDWPIGAEARGDPGFAQMNVLFTDRRIPFQSRSATFLGVALIQNHWNLPNYEGKDQLFALQTTNCSTGDTIYFVRDAHTNNPSLILPGNTVSSGGVNQIGNAGAQIIWIDGQMPEEVSALEGNVIALGNIGLFIHKAIDAVRWEQDQKNMKMAAITFHYEGRIDADMNVAFQRQLNMGAHAGETNVNGNINGVRRIQQYDGDMLNRQINRFARALYDLAIFDEIQAFADINQTEKLTTAEISSIPKSSEVVRVGDGHTRIDFQAGEVVLQNQAHNMITVYGRGTVPLETIRRFPSSFYCIEMFQQDVATEEGARLKIINDWVKSNPNDLALLEFMPKGGAWLQFLQQVPNEMIRDAHGHLTEFAVPTDRRISPLCIGTGTRPETGTDNFIIYAPEKKELKLGWVAQHPDRGALQPIYTEHILNAQAGQVVTAQLAFLGIDYSELTRSYEICKKEMYDTAVSSTRPTRVFGYDGDYIASSLSSQVDLIFPFKQILLTSNDLLQVPERSQDAASRQPILSSYTLPTIIPTSVGADAEPTGSSSSPFGTIYFSEGGNRRYHHLIKIPGGLRQFRINAQLTYKDHYKMAKDILLPPGAQMNCQLLFTRKMEQ